jgi:hypothetical protein
VATRNNVSLDVATCSPVNRYRRFEGTCHPHVQGRRIPSDYKMSRNARQQSLYTELLVKHIYNPMTATLKSAWYLLSWRVVSFNLWRITPNIKSSCRSYMNLELLIFLVARMKVRNNIYNSNWKDTNYATDSKLRCFESRYGQEVFLFFKPSRPPVGPT